MKTAAGTVPTLQEFKVDRESLRVGRGGEGGKGQAKRRVQRGDRVRTEAGRTNKGFWEEVL